MSILDMSDKEKKGEQDEPIRFIEERESIKKTITPYKLI